MASRVVGVFMGEILNLPVEHVNHFFVSYDRSLRYVYRTMQQTKRRPAKKPPAKVREQGLLALAGYDQVFEVFARHLAKGKPLTADGLTFEAQRAIGLEVSLETVREVVVALVEAKLCTRKGLVLTPVVKGSKAKPSDEVTPEQEARVVAYLGARTVRQPDLRRDLVGEVSGERSGHLELVLWALIKKGVVTAGVDQSYRTYRLTTLPTAPGKRPALPGRPDPTAEQFQAYRAMFDHFNVALFESTLPKIVLNFSRHARSYGFFSPDRWKHQDGQGVTHEISINPDTLLARDPRDVASTLVHEMVHLWQQVHGTPPRRCYHDREWAAKMDEVGLVPSSTGEPGGKRTGQNMTHYIADDGPFAVAYKAMPKDLLLPWHSFGSTVRAVPKSKSGAGGEDEGEGAGGEALAPAARKRDSSKLKYTCTGGCGVNVWGRPELKLVCGDCQEPFACQA